MPTVEELVVRIEGDTRLLQSELRKAEALTRRTGARMGNAFDTANRSIQGLGRRLTGLRSVLLGVGLGLAGKQAVELADTFKNMQARIAVVSTSADDAAVAMEGLFQIAQKTGTSFEAAAELFQRVALSRNELGISTQQLLQFTENLQKATVISGVSAIEARNAIIQLGQGLASGTLRGDELRSVMEQMPIVARAIAESMGVSLGVFREMAAEGKITADVVLEGVNKKTEEWEQTFKRMPTTVGRATQKLQNELLRLVGIVDSGSDASKELATAIEGIADTVSSKDFQDGAATFVKNIKEGVKFLVDNKEAFAVAGAALVGTRFGIPGALVAGTAAAVGTAPRGEEKQLQKLADLQREITVLEENRFKGTNFDLDKLAKGGFEGFSELRNLIGKVGDEFESFIGLDPSEKHAQAIERLQDEYETLFQKVLKAREGVEKLKGPAPTQVNDFSGLEEGFKAFDEADILKDTGFTKKVNETIKTLQQQQKAIGMNERELFIYQAVLKSTAEAHTDAEAKVRQLAAAMFDEQQAFNRSAQAAQERIDAFREQIPEDNFLDVALGLKAEADELQSLIGFQKLSSAERRVQIAILEAETQAKGELTKANKEFIAEMVRENEARRQAVARSNVFESINQEIAANKRLIAAISAGTEEYERQKIVLEILNSLKAEGVEITNKEEEAARRLAETLQAQRKVIRDQEEALRAAREASRDFANAIGTAFEDAIVEGKSFRDMLDGLADDMLRIATRVLVTKPLENVLTEMLSPAGGKGGIGGLLGGLLSPPSEQSSTKPVPSQFPGSLSVMPGDVMLPDLDPLRDDWDVWTGDFSTIFNDANANTNRTLDAYNKGSGDIFNANLTGMETIFGGFTTGLGDVLSSLLKSIAGSSSGGGGLGGGILSGIINVGASLLGGGGGFLADNFGGLFGGANADSVFGTGGTFSQDSFFDIGGEGLAGFAKGGDVKAGVPIIVGEKGPEIFKPKSDGTIIPNNRMAKELREMETSASENTISSLVDRSASSDTLSSVLEKILSSKESISFSKEITDKISNTESSKSGMLEKADRFSEIRQNDFLHTDRLKETVERLNASRDRNRETVEKLNASHNRSREIVDRLSASRNNSRESVVSKLSDRESVLDRERLSDRSVTSRDSTLASFFESTDSTSSANQELRISSDTSSREMRSLLEKVSDTSSSDTVLKQIAETSSTSRQSRESDRFEEIFRSVTSAEKLKEMLATKTSSLVHEFSEGGVMTPEGLLPLQKFSKGGVANSPQLALFGEGSTPEAFVPLPDGRSIPVQLKGETTEASVVVHQEINFSTGVVPTVRAEVINLLPQIKEAAARGVQDKRHRNPNFFGKTGAS